MSILDFFNIQSRPSVIQHVCPTSDGESSLLHSAESDRRPNPEHLAGMDPEGSPGAVLESLPSNGGMSRLFYNLHWSILSILCDIQESKTYCENGTKLILELMGVLHQRLYVDKNRPRNSTVLFNWLRQCLNTVSPCCVTTLSTFLENNTSMLEACGSLQTPMEEAVQAVLSPSWGTTVTQSDPMPMSSTSATKPADASTSKSLSRHSSMEMVADDTWFAQEMQEDSPEKTSKNCSYMWRRGAMGNLSSMGPPVEEEFLVELKIRKAPEYQLTTIVKVGTTMQELKSLMTTLDPKCAPLRSKLSTVEKDGPAGFKRGSWNSRGGYGRSRRGNY